MAYYAPFYRPTYYDPVQQSQMGQYNPQYPQQMAQPMQNAQMPMQGQPTNDFLWVLNENEATSYPVAPNNTVTLWDKNLPTIYIKSVNAQGVPSMRILDFTERSATASKSSSSRRTWIEIFPTQICGTERPPSSSSRRTWIEIGMAYGVGRNGRSRPPRGGRGLKSRTNAQYTILKKVVLLAEDVD